MSTLAKRIPPELFRNILGFLQVRDETQEYHPRYTRDYNLLTKHELGQLALVCRDWARICQKHIFAHITLRSKQDFIYLLQMSSSTYSNISRYVANIKLIYTIPCVPWIHLVALETARSFPYYSPDVKLTVEDRSLILEHPKRALSCHSSLPRSPPAFSTNIHTIEFVRITFQY